MTVFRDRTDAGKRLAKELMKYAGRPDVIVLALPRGGVPVGYQVARALRVPLDIFLVRKLGVPDQEELAMGAIASGGIRVLNQDIIRLLDIPEGVIEAATAREQKEIERREHAYRGDRPKPEIRGRTIIIVDDGLATGATMRAAVRALRVQSPSTIIVAVPTGAPDTCEELQKEADDAICLTKPYPFFSIGSWYDDFSQTTDEEVKSILRISDSGLRNENEKVEPETKAEDMSGL